MAQTTPVKRVISKPERISYIFITIAILLIGGLGMATPFVVVLFSYLALDILKFTRSKLVAVLLYLILVSVVGLGFYAFVKEAVIAVPSIASKSIPLLIEYAERHRVQLPFEDVQSFKEVILTAIKTHLAYLGNFAKIATKEMAIAVIGIVVAISIFLNSKLDLSAENTRLSNNLYTLASEFIAQRFRNFYESFKIVMGAQLLISAINTTFTSVFVLWTKLPYPGVVIAVTFLAGLLPIIGNLISNTLIVGIALTLSPKFALAALLFLVVLHKLEYFLNSKIIGDRIKNPMWLTLLGLVVGERLLGIPGMILAPVVLHYLKAETSRIQIPPPTETEPAARIRSDEKQTLVDKT
jgi:predicted PurR-regulated permease PerM